MRMLTDSSFRHAILRLQPQAMTLKDRLHGAAKWFRRHNHPRLTLDAAFYEGLKREGNVLSKDMNFDEPDNLEPDQEEVLVTKKKVVGNFVNYCARREDGNGFAHVVNDMYGVAQQSLYNDNKNLKRDMHKLVSPDPFTKYSQVQDWQPKFKADQGLKNLLVTKYWMTRTDTLAFKVGNAEEQKRILQKYQDVDFALDHNNFPAFTYDVDLMNPVRAIDGFLLAPILFRVGQYIITGPGTVGQTPRSRPIAANARGGNMHIMRIVEITPPLIFYICVVTHFAMSTVTYWNEWDGDFSLYQFWDQLEFNFHNQSKEWQKQVLRTWNLNIFGSERGRGDIPPPVRCAPVLSDSDVLRHQRAEERATGAAAAAGASGA
ncbi:hypothetical protein V5O48_018976 [Marasmius crinis-equi]|uniref:Uncharacterized protein n=1 Tax=Marasmius crinis-equi TaxID=585013 RepID=A0ABR3EJS5_9AGAR